MEQQYMDYGQVVNSNEPNYSLRPTPIDYTKHGQVFYNTHRWEVDEVTGEGRYVSLPFFDKAFISFSYGGRRIQDFGLNAVTANDRIDRQMPPPNEDYVTQYKMINGQYYWGSHYNAREMTLTLSTDGMTQAELDDFKYWFQPGEIRELILSQHPNRGILARVGEIPEISVLPFKREVVTTVNGKEIKVKVIEYKGNVQVKFVMDDPFWYAINDVLGKITYDTAGHGLLADHWIDANGKEQSVLDNDGYKVMLQDHIPISSMVNNKINFANGFTLEEYNKRKYTLDERANSEARIGGEIGAPVINDEKDIQYPLTGAVIGPLYRVAYEDGAVITELPDEWGIEGYDISADGSIIVSSYDDYSLNQKYIIIKDPISVKSGSIFECITDKISATIKIAQYYKKNQQYIFKKISTVQPGAEYQLEDNYYIRIVGSVLKTEWNDEIDGEFTFSKILKCNLIIHNETQGITVNNTTTPSYFYSGNALSYPTVNFSVPIQFNDEGYIITFDNDIVNTEKKYDTLKLEGQFSHELKLTNPSIFMAYNQVINILRKDQQIDVPTMIQLLRDSIGHPAVRSWIINCINIYVNNFSDSSDSTDSIMTVNAQMKEQLLKYMPYLFSSAEDAGITLKEQEPSTVKATSTELDENNLTFSVSDESVNTHLAFENKKDGEPWILYVDSGHTNVQITASIPNGSYFHWQYSNDGGTTWYFLFDDYDYETNRGGWSGTDNKTLTKHQIASKDDIFDKNKLFRCLVSNDTSLTGTNTYIQFKQAISVSVERSNKNGTSSPGSQKTATQNSKCTLYWKISGPYLTGEQTFGGTAMTDYAPTVYYATKTLSNTWVKYDPAAKADYGGQIGAIYDKNGKLNNFSINGDIATFQFNVNENDKEQLRGVKIRLVVNDRFTSSQPGLANQSIYNDTQYIINVKRLEVSDDVIITLKATYNNGITELTNIEKSITDTKRGTDFYYKDGTIRPRSIRPGSKIELSINGVYNFDVNNISILYHEIQMEQWYSVDSDYFIINSADLNSGKIIFTSFNIGEKDSLNWFSTKNQFKISMTNYKQTKDILIGSFGYASAQDLDGTIDNVLQNLVRGSYDRPDVVRKVVLGDQPTTIILKVTQDNDKPTQADGILITYQWFVYKPSSPKDKTFNWESASQVSEIYRIENPEDIHMSQSYELVIDSTEKTGYYACRIKYSLKKPSTGTWTEEKDISPQDKDYIEVNVIPKVTLSNGRSNLNNTYIYYSQDHALYENNSQVIISKSQPFNIIITYDISNYNSGGKSITWYKEKIASKNKLDTTYQNNTNDQVTYSFSFETLDDLIGWIGKKIYCRVIDKHNNIIDGDPPVMINIETKTKREVDVTNRFSPVPSTSSPLSYTFSDSWRWPTIISQENYPAVSKDNNITYSGKFNEDLSAWEFTGTPRSHTIPTGGTTPGARNENAAKTDHYNGATITFTVGRGKVTLYPQQYYTGWLDSIKYYPLWIEDDDNGKYISQEYGEVTITLLSEIIDLDFCYALKIIRGSNEQISEIRDISSDGSFSITLDQVNNNNNNPIQIYLGIYRKTIWPSTIGYSKVVSPDDSDYYNQKSMPKIDGFYLKIKQIMAKPREEQSSSLQSPLSLNTSIMRNINTLQSNNPLVDNLILRTTSSSQNNVFNLNITQLCPISINCGTGEYTMQVKYNTINWPNGIIEPETEDNKIEPKLICYLSSLRYGESITSTESVGDMVLLNNFVFSQQNHFDPLTNAIVPWSETDKTSCHKLTYDGDVPLQNFVLDYKNLYL